MSKRKNIALIFAAALVLRLLYIFEIADNPFFNSPVTDAHTYSQQAREIAAGHWLDYTPGPFWQPPLYPWLAGAVYWLSNGHFFLAMRLVQAVIGAASCVLLYLVGLRLFTANAALLAAFALAFYGTAIYFDAEILPASVAGLLFLMVILTVLASSDKTSPWYWTAPGLLVGLSAINVPTILITVPCIALWASRGGRKAKSSWLRLLAFGSGLLLVIAPVTLRNYLVGDDLVFISWNAGVNFFVGNNPEYPATTEIRPGQAWTDLVGEARRDGIADGSASSDYFFAKALNFISSQPLDYARLLTAKFASFWHGAEIIRNQNIYYARNYSHLLTAILWKHVLAFPFGLVGPLAMLGVLMVRNWKGPVRLILCLSLSYMTGVVLFFVTARYRLPVIPLLLLFAAHAVSKLAAHIRLRRSPAAWGAAAVLLLGLWTNLSVGAMDMSGDAEHYYNLGHAYIEQSHLREGVRALERAAAMAGEDADILFSLGTAHSLSGDHRRAQAVLTRASQRHPRRMDIRLNLGNAYFQNRLYREAATEYLIVLKAHPDDRMTLRSAARALARSGQHEMAIARYEPLQARNPTDLESYLALGYLYQQNGRRGDALAQFEGALERDPRHLTALLEVGQLRLAAGDLAGSHAALRRAARYHPKSPQVHASLGDVYTAQQQWGPALAAYRKVLEIDPDHADVRARITRIVRQMVE